MTTTTNCVDFFRFDGYEDVFIEDGHYLYACAEPYGWAYLVTVVDYDKKGIRGETAGADTKYLERLPMADRDDALTIIEKETEIAAYISIFDEKAAGGMDPKEAAEEAREEARELAREMMYETKECINDAPYMVSVCNAGPIHGEETVIGEFASLEVAFAAFNGVAEEFRWGEWEEGKTLFIWEAKSDGWDSVASMTVEEARELDWKR